MNDKDRDELLTIYMKVKGRHPVYKEFGNVTLGEYYQLKHIFANNPDGISIEVMVEVIRVLIKWPYEEILQKNVHLLVKLYKFAIELIDYVNEQSKMLSSKITADEIRAGIENLNKYSDITSLKLVADFYKDSPVDAAEKRTYNEAFAAWMYNKERNEFDREYNRIKTKS